jgi:glycosyltransferase involved in cell wall biosynthesis
MDYSHFISNASFVVPDDLVDSAWLEHGAFAFWLVENLRPRSIVELGTHNGYSYFCFCQAVRLFNVKASCYAIDTWQGDEHAGFYGEDVFQNVVSRNEKYSSFSQLLRMRFDEALRHFPDGSIDILHIDGRHFYNDVKFDFESWRSKLSDRAIVLFHDTEVRERNFGVWKLFEELSASFPAFNFLHGHGLGVLAVEKVPAKIAALFDAEKREPEDIRRAYARLGAADLGRWLTVENGRIAELLVHAKAEEQSLRADLTALKAELKTLQSGATGRNGASSRERELERELAQARNRPWKEVRNKLRFRLYTSLSSLCAPISAKTAARYERSARKRDPNRSSPDSIVAGASAFTYAGKVARDPAKQDILIVSHEASRTGAPILALNLAQRLSARYNITSLCLRGGEILDDFNACSEKVFNANLRSMNSKSYSRLIRRVCAKRSYAFAVVNSISSHAVLNVLTEQGVPSVLLLHEFASYTQKKTAFAEAARWASETVFSARLVLDNAVDITAMDITPRLHILPQGKCHVPVDATRAASGNSERNRLRNALRPAGECDDSFVVLGAGTVEIRKGVDLFLETATRVLRAPGGEKVRFAWIGDGYAPERDLAYSAYLRDQLRRAAIEDRVTLLPPTSEIEFAYELSNLLLLPSRLDPLPNVAIDAMFRGLPVLCFDKASGIADLLRQAGLESACIAEYIDTSMLAEKVLRLANSSEFYDEISRKTRDFATNTFDFDRYVQRIEALGQNAKARASNADTDIADIVASGCFRPDFFDANAARTSAMAKDVRDYMDRLSWVFGARKPEPGFSPFAYAECEKSGYEGTHEAYGDFLRKGRPAGPWLLPVLEGGVEETEAVPAVTLKTALHVHAYFSDQLQEILVRLKRNRTQPDLFFSVRSQSAADRVREVFTGYKGRVAMVREVPNAGRDIGPLLTEFGRTLVESYDVVGHIHVKKSGHVDDRSFVEAWSHFLFENLLGGSDGGRMMDLALHRMQTHEKIGLIYPDDPNLIGWTRNMRVAEGVAQRMGHSSLPRAINFPIGTMFWMRAAALKPFIDLGLDWSDYPSEPLPEDGTILHALERLFGVVPVLDGWESVVSNIRGVTR